MIVLRKIKKKKKKKKININIIVIVLVLLTTVFSFYITILNIRHSTTTTSSLFDNINININISDEKTSITTTGFATYYSSSSKKQQKQKQQSNNNNNNNNNNELQKQQPPPHHHNITTTSETTTTTAKEMLISTTTSSTNNNMIKEEEPLSSSSSSSSSNSNVVIVTKVFSNEAEYQRMLCLVQAAYNRQYGNHDYVIFTTLPWPEEAILEIQNIVKPANLQVVLEGPSTLMGYLDRLTKEEERIFLAKRCGINDGNYTKLTWFNHCYENNSTNANKASLGYSWQSEFRSYHIWNHVALRDYKYMIFFDGDAHLTRSLQFDPITNIMIPLNASLLGYFPNGKIKGNTIQGRLFVQKLISSYNINNNGGGDNDNDNKKFICSITKSKQTGALQPKLCSTTSQQQESSNFIFQQIAGFHHVTNLDVYRQDIHQKFLQKFIGPYPFSRMWDDQIATIVVGMYDTYLNNGNGGSRVYDYRQVHGGGGGGGRGSNNNNKTSYHLKLAHHGMYDNYGHLDKAPKNKNELMELVIKNTFPLGYELCSNIPV